MKALSVVVTGRVQGVWFRQSTCNEANKLGVAGWVRNLSCGRVEAHFEGEDELVETLLRWAHKGPTAAEVVEVIAKEINPLGLVLPFVERASK
jgi:acylphosphatase